MVVWRTANSITNSKTHAAIEFSGRVGGLVVLVTESVRIDFEHMKKINEQKIQKQAELIAETLRRAGEPEGEVQRRVLRALERARSRTVKCELAVNRFTGCMSITDSARDLGVRRADLFSWLERSEWLRCTTDGWRATDGALAAGWVVMRGPRSIRWVQVTEAGRLKIACCIGITGRAAP